MGIWSVRNRTSAARPKSSLCKLVASKKVLARRLLHPLQAVSNCPNKKGQQMHCTRTEHGNKRKFARARLFSAGILVDEAQRLNCLIRDMGPHGAQIRLSASQLVPDCGYLINLRSGAAHRAYPIWRKGSLSGLRLAEAHMITALPAHLGYLAHHHP